MARTARPWWRSRWWTPSFSLFLGVLIFAALALGGEPDDGALGFAVMAVLAAAFLLGSRSETLQGLGGPGRDERWAMIDLRASAFAGGVLILAIIGAWLYEAANGRDAEAYARLAAIAGAAYLTAFVWLRRRS